MEQFLSSVGITEPKEIIYNPSYEQLFEDEMKPGLEGYARGYLTELGAVNVLTGEYTGRSPKDKFIVIDDATRDSLWWKKRKPTAPADLIARGDAGRRGGVRSCSCSFCSQRGER